MFRKAERRQAKLRLALAGPSGSGKTFSSLLIAKGLGGPIAMIDTERRSGELYSHVCDYDVAGLTPPFSPEKYIDAIHTAENSGYNVLIIDSLSHAWAGTGGILDIKDNIAKSSKSMNDFTAWREATPQHNALVDAILESSCHIILTLRTKTSYEIVQGENGKMKVTKVGLAFIQREGLEYEMTLVLDLSVDGHVATSSKDRTGLFDGKYFLPSDVTGKMLLSWLNMEKKEELPSSPKEDPKSKLLYQIHSDLAQLGLREYEKAYRDYACTRYQCSALEDLSEDQLKEQVALLYQCRRKAKLQQFREILNQKKIAA